MAALATAFSSTERQDAQPQILKGLDADKLPPPPTAATALTSRSDMGVLSPSGRCCSSASTIQLAMMVARIMYSNGVRGLRTGRRRGGGEGDGQGGQRAVQQTARPPPEGLTVTRSGAHASPALILGGRGEAEPLQLRPPATSPPPRKSGWPSAPRTAPPGYAAQREGGSEPPARAGGGTPRRRTVLPKGTRSHMYLHRHVNIHVPRVPNARTRSAGVMSPAHTRRHLQPGARTGSRPRRAHTYTDADSPSGALQAARALCTRTKGAQGRVRGRGSAQRPP